MSARRLDKIQPDSFKFNRENLRWAKAKIREYPKGKQASAVIPVLWKAQEQEGWTSEPAIRYVADMLDMSFIRVLEVATFYTMFHLSPVGKKAHIQVCGTTACQLRGAEGIIRVCKKRIAENPHVVSQDGDFSWEEVECLGACTNAPMVQVTKDVYEDLTPEAMHTILDEFEAGRTPKPGPQNGRQFSAPLGKLTALTDPSLYDGSRLSGKGKNKPAKKTAAKKTAAKSVAKKPAVKTPTTKKTAAKATKATRADVPVADKHKPQGLKAARAGGPDDLKQISGVGPKIEGILHSLGFFHFDQIAAWKKKEREWVDGYLRFKGRIDRDEWIKQARALAREVKNAK
jgi:NADH-quinone oxidoreductase subunit E